VPGSWEFVLLGLAAFRLWRLIAEDTILDRPRGWVTGRVGEYWGTFIVCPWCSGAWLSFAWWLAWVAWPHGVLVASTPLALSAVVGLIAANIDPVGD